MIPIPNSYPVKAIYNQDTGKIEYKPIRSIKGDLIRKLKIDRVGGYMNVYTDATNRDLYEEYFAKATDFMDEFGWSMVGKPILINHGMDGAFKSMHVGVFDFENEDDMGRYVEGRLFDQQEYEAMLSKYAARRGLNWTAEDISKKANLAYKTVQAFFATNKAHWSSGALPQEVEVDPEDGFIKRWPRIEGSATMTPAEPDGTEVLIKGVVPNFEYSLKSAFEQLDAILNETFDMSIPANPAREAQPIERNADEISFTTSNAANVQITWQNTPILSKIKGLPMELLNQIMDLLKQLATSLGAEAAQEGDAMANAVVDELKADPTIPKPDELAKMAPEDMQKAVEVVAEKAIASFNAKVAQKKAQADAVAKTFESHIKNAERTAKPVDPFGAGGSNIGNPRNNPRIQVGDNLKYAHLSADDMALGIMTMMAAAKTSGVPVSLKTFVDAGALSPEFMQEFKGKVQDFAKSNPYGNTSDGIKRNSTIKSLAIKANEIDGTGNTGFGAEWVGNFWSTNLWAKERYPLVYDKMLEKGMWTEELGDGFQTAYFPIESSDPTAYRAPQSIDLDAVNHPAATAKIVPFGTGYVSVTPSEIKIATSYTRIFDEDSLIRLAPQVNKQLTAKAYETRDQVLINGDTETSASTNINKIDGTPTSTGLTQDYYLTSNGFRKMALVTAPAASVTSAVSAAGTLTDAQYLTTRKLFSGELRPYLRDSGLFIVDPDTYEASLAFASLKTDDVNRTGATVREGELAKMWGVEVFNSGFLPSTNTAGKVSVTAGNNIYGTILGVFARHWGVAYKRQIIIDTDFDIMSGAYVYVLSLRIGVVARGTKAAVASYYVAH